jgi:hypothetical protein
MVKRFMMGDSQGPRGLEPQVAEIPQTSLRRCL